MESWLSGRKRLTANEVGVLKPLVGSNPTLSANWNFARKKVQPRGAERAARLGFERAFWAKRKRIYQSKYGSSRFVLEMLPFLIYPHSLTIYPLDSRILRRHEPVRAKTLLCPQFREFSLLALLSCRAFFVFARHILRT